MYCLISVVIRQWTAVHEESHAQKRRMLQISAGHDLPRSPVFSAATGCLVVVDWEGERVLGGIELPKPTGFLVEDGKLHVALWEHDEIATLNGSQIVGRLKHPWFNHIHTLDRTPRGLLVSSSGTDLLAELDESGSLLWQCFLFENGYGGARFRFSQSFDRGRDYNRRYLPAALTTHPNSAILIDDDTVLATLFSTGELIRIDRRSARVDVLLRGLKRPHAIRRRAEGGYMLCDTEGGAVLLLDKDLGLADRITVSAPWIQDAVFAGDRLLVVGNRRIIASPLAAESAAADGDNYVIELHNGAPRKKLSFGTENRIYMVEPIAQADAEAIARSFGEGALDTSWLRWESPCA